MGKIIIIELVYDLIMTFRVNLLHSVIALMSRKFLLEKGTISES